MFLVVNKDTTEYKIQEENELEPWNINVIPSIHLEV